MHSIFKRGRPRKFQAEDRRQLADLIREHGIRGARRESKVSISQLTMIRIAREFGISLKKGKRPKKAA